MVLVYYIGCLFEFNELYLNCTFRLILCNITNY